MKINGVMFLLLSIKKWRPLRQATNSLLFIIVSSTASQLSLAAECQYEVIDEWSTGFKAEISIINHDDPINDWQLSWSWSDGSTLNNSWNATLNCASGNCVATPPSWLPVIHREQTYTFGFTANKDVDATDRNIVIQGSICHESAVTSESQTLWQLDGETSSLQYVSMKKDHTAEINTFVAANGEPTALSGSITRSGDAILAIDLNDVSTGVSIRDGRLLDWLFETELLPTAYFRTHIDMSTVADINAGDTRLQTLNGELILHGVKQAISAEVLIAKVADDEVVVSTVQPINISSEQFDMAAGIEILRGLAGLTTIGESVPVYFHLRYVAVSTNSSTQAINMPAAPLSPSGLSGQFNVETTQAELHWQDSSDNETLLLVRRRPLGGNWQTSAELSAGSTHFIEGLPDEGEFDYKVIALNNSVPSLPTDILNLTVTESDQLARGQQIYQAQCAACHGLEGEGDIASALDIQRDVGPLVSYITDSMPKSNPSACDQQCAEDVATFIETLWVTEADCNDSLTPISYGARQLKILTRSEYQRSVEDLLGVSFFAAEGLSADTKVGLFTNNTHSALTAASYSNYLRVAESIAQWSAEKNFKPALECESWNQDCVNQFIDVLAPKILRRPLTVDEISAYQDMAEGNYTSEDVKAGITMALEGMLASPQFLYRHELGEVNPDNSEIDNDAFELTSYEMATFLAYTFTGSTPDQQLMEAAARDELRNETYILSHAQRLAESAGLVMSEFVGSWLGTADLALSAKDPAVWPGFEELVPHMQEELNKTFSYIMLEPTEQFASIYAANFTFLNQTLAEHYGIGGVSGSQMESVNTVDRGGILANGAFMARWGEAVESSPILRSVRVRRRMLCQEQPDPPAGTFAAREQKLSELSALLQEPTTTNRLKYHRLTEDAPCTNCHSQYINPLGFGMEDFDSVGRVRTSDLNGNSIDALGELFAYSDYSNINESLSFNGAQDLGKKLSELSSAQSCLPKQLFRYFIGLGDQDIDSSNPEGPQLSEGEKAGYACEIDRLSQTLMQESPRAMLERFGVLDAVRYRKAWQRN